MLSDFYMEVCKVTQTKCQDITGKYPSTFTRDVSADRIGTGVIEDNAIQMNKKYASGGYSKEKYFAKMKGNQFLFGELEECDDNVLLKLTKKVNIFKTAIWKRCSRMMINTR